MSRIIPARTASIRFKPGRPAFFVARGLSKTYQMGELQVHALQDVDLTIYRDEFIVLLGPSGSGKPTALKSTSMCLNPATTKQAEKESPR